MRPKSLLAFAGFVALIAGTFCPLLRPFGLFSWDMYGLNKPYGVVVLVIAIAGALTVITGLNKAAKILAWTSLGLVVLLYLAAVMKVNTSFTFIPFKNVAAGLSKLIKYKWGWYVLFIGAICTVLGTLGKAKRFDQTQLQTV